MVAKSGVTIDGMRVRNNDTSARTVGFGNAGKKSAQSIRRTQGSVSMRKNSSPRTKKRNEDFGLKKNSETARAARLKANEDFLKPVSTFEFDLSSKELRPDYSLKHRDVTEAPTRKRKHKKKGHKKGKIIALLVVFVLAAGATGALLWGNKLISKLTDGQSGIFDLIGAISSNVKLKTDENGRTNILIFGTSGYDMSGSVGYGEHDGSQLTDSIMVVSVDQESRDVAMVSLPRDLYVGNTCTATGKVNEVYYCSNLSGDDEAGGANALKATMKEIFDLDIQYRVHVDWGALVQIVDGLGGITVTLDEDIEDDWTGTFIKAGEPVTLNGERALGLARARHGTEMGDFTRGNSQQKILAAIQNKLVNEGIDFGTALSLIDAVGDNVRMDFSAEEIKSVFYLAKEMSLDSMRQIPLIDYNNNIYYLSTAEMNGISYVVPAGGIRNYTNIQNYVKQMLSADPAAREGATIVILNGSGKDGAAAAEKDKLKKNGIAIEKVGDAPEGEFVESYYLYDVSGEKVATVESLAKKYGVEARSAQEIPAGIDTTGIDVLIILGSGAE